MKTDIQSLDIHSSIVHGRENHSAAIKALQGEEDKYEVASGRTPKLAFIKALEKIGIKWRDIPENVRANHGSTWDIIPRVIRYLADLS